MRDIYGREIENVGKRDPLSLTHFYKSGDNTRSYNSPYSSFHKSHALFLNCLSRYFREKKQIAKLKNVFTVGALLSLLLYSAKQKFSSLSWFAHIGVIRLGPINLVRWWKQIV